MPYGEEKKEVCEMKRVRGTYAVVYGRYPTKDSTWEVLLCDVFEDHPYVTCNAEILESRNPFAPLVHRWEQLCKLAVDNTGSEIQKLMKLFVDVLKNELQDTPSRVKKFKDTGCASFEDLQFIFKPGQLFFRSKPPIAAGICESYGHGHVSVSQIRWSGCDYSTIISSFCIPYLDGIRPLSDLSARPHWACPENDIKALKAALIKRGRKYEALRSIHLRFHVSSSKAEKTQDIQLSSPDVDVVRKPVNNVSYKGRLTDIQSEAPASENVCGNPKGNTTLKDSRLPIKPVRFHGTSYA
ncbi:hypothetical protein IL306_006814 [Fusarium sp. DS 682]|nr:hypothetical protein IL306_006814 [Fusarium sp. DS 682]